VNTSGKAAILKIGRGMIHHLIKYKIDIINYGTRE